MNDSLKAPKKGPMSDSNPDYLGLYEKGLQGDFYGADYYRPPRSDIDSAIIYDDGEDKRTTAAFIALNFAPKRVLEAGCAMGLLVKALRGYGVEAEGFDFSRWCIDNAHPTARAWVRWGEDLWMRWTSASAWDVIETGSRSELKLRAICNHPGIGENPRPRQLLRR
jgi:2-polyprenyl-3-methyl-5-hydroxy-6-metoxy-1,4-benzoquinol methylase